MNPSPETNGNRPDSDADDRVRRAYRSATAGLNESPSAAVRAAVLAAAARAVQARPTGVAADGVVPVLRGTARYRMPMAAAASVLVGTIAVLLAQRTEENLPALEEPASLTVRADQATSPVAPAQPKPAEVAQARRPSAPLGAAESERAAGVDNGGPLAADGRVRSPQRSSNESRLKESAAPVSSAQESKLLESSAVAPAATTSTPAPAAFRELAAAPAVGRVSADAQPTAKRESADAAAGAAAERDARTPAAQSTLNKVARADALARTAQPESASVPAVPPPDRVTARPVQRTAPVADVPGLAARFESTLVPSDVAADPKRWVERIVRLRSEGRHELADAELKLFRTRYPEETIPPTAIR